MDAVRCTGLGFRAKGLGFRDLMDAVRYSGGDMYHTTPQTLIDAWCLPAGN